MADFTGAAKAIYTMMNSQRYNTATTLLIPYQQRVSAGECYSGRINLTRNKNGFDGVTRLGGGICNVAVGAVMFMVRSMYQARLS